ncbi:MAG TPA: aspartate aminotransferase family protein, partial [Gemmatimonadales bacterium]|nr:aspartate aminotransferase family protein [Gemmatimonadales bacterium]
MRFDTSRALLAEAQRYLAGGVSTIMRADMRPVPLYFESGKGSRLVDVDHNEYIDYTLAFGPLILGHSHPAIVEAVKEQLLRGQAFGAQHRLEPAVAKQIHELVPCADLVVFSNTGTEAVQVALRVARAATGKNRFIKFEGHYHGWMDNVLVSYRGTADQLGSRGSPRAVQTSRGQSPLAMEEPLVLPWNDLSAVESALRLNDGEIAAIITEPVMFNSGGIEPAPGYLRGLRDLCDRHGVVLIFDEVITGFRVALGGAQELYGVIPDLAVFGKALAAGFPLSAVAGRADLLDLIASRAVVHAGTFNGNPISLAAAHAALTELAHSGGSTFEAASRNAERLREGIVSALSAVGIQASAHGVGPAFVISIGAREPLRDYRDLLDIDWDTYGRFAEALLGEGI